MAVLMMFRLKTLIESDYRQHLVVVVVAAVVIDCCCHWCLVV